MNPGGPGQSRLGWAPYWAGSLPDEVLERFDVVTFDPRESLGRLQLPGRLLVPGEGATCAA